MLAATKLSLKVRCKAKFENKQHVTEKGFAHFSFTAQLINIFCLALSLHLKHYLRL